MENIEEKIGKEIEKNRINKKNYVWIVFTLIFTLIAIIYSYVTDLGVIAKQTINNDLLTQNRQSSTLANLDKKSFYHINTQESKENSSLTIDENKQNIVELDKQSLQVNKTELLAKNNIEESSIEKKEIENITKIDKSSKAKESKKTHRVQKDDKVALATKVELEKNIKPIKKSEELKIEKVSPTLSIEKNKKEQKIHNKKDDTKQAIEKRKEINLVAKVEVPKAEFKLNYCYSYKPAVSSFNKDCEESLNTFVKQNKDATRYEILGIIDLEDIKNLSNKSDKNQALLAKNRVLAVKNILEKKTSSLIDNELLYLKSELPNRGFVIRAYFN